MLNVKELLKIEEDYHPYQDQHVVISSPHPLVEAPMDAWTHSQAPLSQSNEEPEMRI
jgi:hypothetical protein